MVNDSKPSGPVIFATIVITLWIGAALLGVIFLNASSGELSEMFAFSQIIPILISSFYFGQAGGLLVAFVASLVSGSLIIFNIDEVNSIFVQRIMFQIISFNSVALLTSFLSDQEKKHRKRIAHQLERITALRAIDKAINAGADLHATMYILLESLSRLLDVEAAAIWLHNAKTGELELKASLGFLGEYGYHIQNSEESYASQALCELCTIFHPNFDEEDPVLANLVPGNGVIDYYAVPLVAQGETKGVLEVYNRAPHIDEGWRNYLETLVGQAAIAITQSRLLENLQQVNTEMLQAYEETLRGWSRALDMRDRETEGHTQRVVALSVKLAERMGIHGEQLVNFQRGAILHDIGKMGVPDNILLKRGPLTEQEWEIMRKHPSFAQLLLSPIKYLEGAMIIPYYHHERWDGSGYPLGLHGKEIPREARIFAIVDVWDALHSDRPYREALSNKTCLQYIQEQSGKLFDPEVVDAFLSMIQEESVAIRTSKMVPTPQSGDSNEMGEMNFEV